MTKLADQNDPYVQRTNQYGPYGYIPLLAPAGLFVAVYALLFVGHTFRTWKSRAWWTSMIAIGCILETAGNALRLYGHFDATTNIDAYIAMQVIVVCTPVFFAATHFTILSKVLLATGIQIGPLPNRMVLPFFVFLDVASLAVQGAGSAIAAINEQDGKDANGGGNIVIAGLAIQLFGYLCFDVLSILFAKRSWSNLTQHAKVVLASSFISALLVLLRSSFRIGEMARGWVGPVSTTEWYYYAFDCAPVSLAVLLLLVFYPADILSDKSASNLDVDEAVGSQPATNAGSSKLLLQSRQNSTSSGGIVKSHKSEASSFA